MCGIAGVFLWQGEPDTQRLKRALQALRHRGPDAQQLWCRRGVGLAHARLSIIDLEGGIQPLHSRDGQLHLVANGEIYNDPALRMQYRNASVQPGSGSDCESILQVYQAGGRDGIRRLHGMFAFALYDERQNCLLLARDRLGIKPLYYARLPGGWAFASEIKGLLPLLGRVPVLDAQALAGFLDYQFSTGCDTIFQGIRRVLPGQSILLTAEGTQDAETYWSPLAIRPRSLGLEEAVEAFGPLWDSVMREHLRSDVPLGLFLSGGIDSSVLLASLCEQYGQPLHTYSVGFGEGRDELAQAEALARRFGSEHTSLVLTRAQLFERIAHTVWATDDLMRDYACLPLSLLAERAAQDLKVVFSGEGGDEAFAGYRRYADSVEGWLKALAFGTGGFRTHGEWGRRRETRAALSGALRAVDTRLPFRTHWAETPPDWSRMQQRQYVDLKTALPDNLLVKADRILMAFGLEGRVPFCDHRLVAFGLSLPDAVKYRQRRGKYLIRRWAEKVLPKDHLQRPKRGFYVPVPEWISGRFLDQLELVLLADRAVREWFDPIACRRLFDRQRSKGGCTRAIWGLMQFAIWHRFMVEQPGLQPAVCENPLDVIRG